MKHEICDDCETVVHCSQHGCIPKQPLSENWSVPLKVSTGQLSILDTKPNYNITFYNNSEGGTGKEVGKLDFNGPELVFTGDAEESAKVFIDWVARHFRGRLEAERRAALAEKPNV